MLLLSHPSKIMLSYLESTVMYIIYKRTFLKLHNQYLLPFLLKEQEKKIPHKKYWTNEKKKFR